jgi:hypothetical protein
MTVKKLTLPYIFEMFAIFTQQYYIVAYRPAVKQGLCKQQPFLGNGLVNTFPRQTILTQQ